MYSTLHVALLAFASLLLGASACDSGSDIVATPTAPRGDEPPAGQSDADPCAGYPLDGGSGESLSGQSGGELLDRLAGEWYLRLDIPTQMMVGAEEICTVYTAEDSPSRATVSGDTAKNESFFEGSAYYADEDVIVQDGRAYDGPYKVFARVGGR